MSSAVCKTLRLPLNCARIVRCHGNLTFRPRRCAVHTSSLLCGQHDSQFKEAQSRVTSLKEEPDNNVKLMLYALYKQASAGECNVPKPGMMDFVGKAKWEAWNGLKQLSQDEAQLRYIDLVSELASKEVGEGTDDSHASRQLILSSVVDDIHLISINRPEKKNAITIQMYAEIIQALSEAAADDSTLTVITGTGDYFSSGNDLSNIANVNPSEIRQMAEKGGEILRQFVCAIIDHPKPLVSLINGPAIGITVTTLGLFDLVYASDRATLQTPFTQLGQTPEGCSSYTFPKLMGYAKASELLLFNQLVTAQQACDRGLVTEVFPDEVFRKETWNRLRQYATLPKQCLKVSKNVLRQHNQSLLHEINRKECDQLVQQWQTEECANAVMAFFLKKK